MSMVCISGSFDEPLKQMTFMTKPFFHVILFRNLGDYRALSLDHVFYVHYYSIFPIHFTHAIMK